MLAITPLFMYTRLRTQRSRDHLITQSIGYQRWSLSGGVHGEAGCFSPIYYFSSLSTAQDKQGHDIKSQIFRMGPQGYHISFQPTTSWGETSTAKAAGDLKCSRTARGHTLGAACSEVCIESACMHVRIVAKEIKSLPSINSTCFSSCVCVCRFASEHCPALPSLYGL